MIHLDYTNKYSNAVQRHDVCYQFYGQNLVVMFLGYKVFHVN